VVRGFVLVPTEADTEDEPAFRRPVECGDRLGGDDRVALRDEADAGADAEAAIMASATNGSSVRLYSSRSSSSPVGGAVFLVVGMCVCSGT
jgi:hypothetical protein